jgi:hypothetical protein
LQEAHEDRYFDVFAEYAKAAPGDILIEITACNRGPEVAQLYVLPTLWFRNTWAWWPDQPKPSLREAAGENGASMIEALHSELGSFFLHCQGRPPLLFTENDTNNERLFGTPNPTPYVKDGINNYIVSGMQAAVNPNGTGTKAAANYGLDVGAGEAAVLRLRLTGDASGRPFGDPFEQIMQDRRREADAFYQALTPPGVREDAANVMRQALAGMLWSKQFFTSTPTNGSRNTASTHCGRRPARGLNQPPIDDIESYWSPMEKAEVARMLARSIVGSPETVRLGIEALVTETRADELIVVSDVYEHSARLRSFELIACVAEAARGA